VSRANQGRPLASDHELIKRLVERDGDALSELYDRYSALVYSVALRVLRDTGAAEEILQDIFYSLWEKAARFDATRGSLAGWLLVMSRNRAISRLRRRGPEQSEDMEQMTVAFPAWIEQDLGQRALLATAQKAITDLADGQREAIELAYFEGLTHSEIAQRTGQPLGTIKTRVRTALEILKKTLNP
jgi:RNA polymerase sigma-70 factor (ECF subfamily)